MDLLFPTGVRCLACGAAVHGDLLCEACQAQLTSCRVEAPICALCGHSVETGGPCRFCHGDLPPYVMLRAAWMHTGIPRQLVLALKHHALEAAADVLAEGIRDVILPLTLPEDTVVTWVTMPKQRLRERGIDHGRLLAEKVAALLGLPSRQLLIRLTTPRTQQGLDRKLRLTNLQGAFTCESGIPAHILLVDDVTTTGATALTCAQSLQASGAAFVWIVTATQAMK